MKSLLIKDTTKEEREQIVRESLGMTGGMCDGCAASLADMYDDYIYGIKEISDINASFRPNYICGDEDNARNGISCNMQ